MKQRDEKRETRKLPMSAEESGSWSFMRHWC